MAFSLVMFLYISFAVSVHWSYEAMKTECMGRILPMSIHLLKVKQSWASDNHQTNRLVHLLVSTYEFREGSQNSSTKTERSAIVHYPRVSTHRPPTKEVCPLDTSGLALRGRWRRLATDLHICSAFHRR